MPLVAPEICRFSINGLYGGEKTAMIWDMRLVETVPSVDQRAGAIQAQAQDILHAYDDRLLPLQVKEFQAVSVSWVDLDSLTGSTGFVSTGGGDTWPKVGGSGSTNQGQAPQVAALITKVAPGGGRATRNGRVYFPAFTESATPIATPGNLGATEQAALTTAFEQFSSDCSNALGNLPGFGNWVTNNVVVHTTSEIVAGKRVISYAGSSTVTAMVCQSRLATQAGRCR